MRELLHCSVVSAVHCEGIVHVFISNICNVTTVLYVLEIVDQHNTDTTLAVFAQHSIIADIILAFSREFSHLIWKIKCLVWKTCQLLHIICTYRPPISPCLVVCDAPSPCLFQHAALCRPPSLCSLHMHS